MAVGVQVTVTDSHHPALRMRTWLFFTVPVPVIRMLVLARGTAEPTGWPPDHGALRAADADLR